MEKTTVYLSSEQKAALSRAAAAAGRSEATLIRAGIDAVTAQSRIGEVAAPYAAVDPAARPESAEPPRPRWVSREFFLAEVIEVQADPGLQDDLRELAGGTTDDEPIA